MHTHNNHNNRVATSNSVGNASNSHTTANSSGNKKRSASDAALPKNHARKTKIRKTVAYSHVCHLPDDIFSIIFSFMNKREGARASLACKRITDAFRASVKPDPFKSIIFCAKHKHLRAFAYITSAAPETNKHHSDTNTNEPSECALQLKSVGYSVSDKPIVLPNSVNRFALYLADDSNSLMKILKEEIPQHQLLSYLYHLACNNMRRYRTGNMEQMYGRSRWNLGDIHITTELLGDMNKLEAVLECIRIEQGFSLGSNDQQYFWDVTHLVKQMTGRMSDRPLHISDKTKKMQEIINWSSLLSSPHRLMRAVELLIENIAKSISSSSERYYGKGGGKWPEDENDRICYHISDQAILGMIDQVAIDYILKNQRCIKDDLQQTIISMCVEKMASGANTGYAHYMCYMVRNVCNGDVELRGVARKLFHCATLYDATSPDEIEMVIYHLESTMKRCTKRTSPKKDDFLIAGSSSMYFANMIKQSASAYRIMEVLTSPKGVFAGVVPSEICESIASRIHADYHACVNNGMSNSETMTCGNKSSKHHRHMLPKRSTIAPTASFPPQEANPQAPRNKEKKLAYAFSPVLGFLSNIVTWPSFPVSARSNCLLKIISIMVTQNIPMGETALSRILLREDLVLDNAYLWCMYHAYYHDNRILWPGLFAKLQKLANKEKIGKITKEDMEQFLHTKLCPSASATKKVKISKTKDKFLGDIIQLFDQAFDLGKLGENTKKNLSERIALGMRVYPSSPLFNLDMKMLTKIGVALISKK